MSNIANMAYDLLDDEDIIDLVDENDLVEYVGEPKRLTSMRLSDRETQIGIDTTEEDEYETVSSDRDFHDKLFSVSRYVVVKERSHLEIFMRTPKGEFVSIAYGNI